MTYTKIAFLLLSVFATQAVATGQAPAVLAKMDLVRLVRHQPAMHHVGARLRVRVPDAVGLREASFRRTQVRGSGRSIHSAH